MMNSPSPPTEEVMTYVCFHNNSSFWFGEVIHRRDDDMWVEVVSPSTRYSPERRHGMIVPASRVIAEGRRKLVQRIERAGGTIDDRSNGGRNERRRG